MPEISDAELASLKAQAKAGEKAQALYEGLRTQWDAAAPELAALPELRKQVQGFHAERLDSTFKAAGVVDPKVRRIFDLEYQDVQAPEGKEKPALGDWLASLQALPPAERPAHLAPFLAAPAASGVVAPARVAVGLPDASKGTQPVAGAPGQYTAEAIAAMSPADFTAQKEAIFRSAGLPLPPK